MFTRKRMDKIDREFEMLKYSYQIDRATKVAIPEPFPKSELVKQLKEKDKEIEELRTSLSVWKGRAERFYGAYDRERSKEPDTFSKTYHYVEKVNGSTRFAGDLTAYEVLEKLGSVNVYFGPEGLPTYYQHRYHTTPNHLVDIVVKEVVVKYDYREYLDNMPSYGDILEGHEVVERLKLHGYDYSERMLYGGFGLIKELEQCTLKITITERED